MWSKIDKKKLKTVTRHSGATPESVNYGFSET